MLVHYRYTGSMARTHTLPDGSTVEFHYSPEGGASVTLPPMQVTAGANLEISWMRQLHCELRLFEAMRRLDDAGAGEGFHEVEAADVLETYPVREGRVVNVWVRDTKNLGFCAPFVAAFLYEGKSRPTLLRSAVGIGLFEGQQGQLHLPASPDEVHEFISSYLSYEPEAVAALLNFQDSEKYQQARTHWVALQGGRQLSEVVVKKDHIPYTRMAKRIKEVGIARYATAWACDVEAEREDGRIVSPFVVVEFSGSLTPELTSRLNKLVSDEGLSIVKWELPSDAHEWIKWKHRRSFALVRNNNLVNDGSLAWLGEEMNRAWAAGGRGSGFRRAT